MGTAISVPDSASRGFARRSRRTTSTPITSSPWIAAETNSVGPGRLPCTTWADIVTGV